MLKWPLAHVCVHWLLCFTRRLLLLQEMSRGARLLPLPKVTGGLQRVVKGWAGTKNAPHCSHAGRRLAVLDWPEAGSLPLRLRNTGETQRKT